MNRSPFHIGELEAQERAGGGSSGGGIRDFMTEQHRDFFAALPFVVVAGQDGGWPVATVLEGAPGFVTAPDAHTLRIAARPAASDPAAAGLVRGRPLGLLGIDFTTRRRNRANGVIIESGPGGLTVAIKQSFGNCPKYIHVRRVAPAPVQAGPSEAIDLLDAGLDAAARDAIARADTFFVASQALEADGAVGLDLSHRGGPSGFVRVEGETLTIPDYAGNRYFNTLGNLVAWPRAALLFPDLERGQLLGLQGTVEILWDGPEIRAFPGAERLWRVRDQRAWRSPHGLKKVA